MRASTSPISYLMASSLTPILAMSYLSIFGVTATANGFDRDGLIVAIAAGLILLALLVARRGMRLLAIVASLGAAGTSIYDYFDVAGTTGVTVDWGLWLALLSSVAIVGVLIAQVVRHRAAESS
jgi:hypothetical protein